MSPMVQGKSYSLGNEESVSSHIQLASEIEAAINSLKEEGLTLVLVADDEQLLGMFGIEDEIRPESTNLSLSGCIILAFGKPLCSLAIIRKQPRRLQQTLALPPITVTSCLRTK